MAMPCRSCRKLGRVVNTEHRKDATYRWLVCDHCAVKYRTIEQYFPLKPGPVRGTPRSGPRQNGVRNGNAVFTETDILTVRALAAKGVLQKDIATRFGMSPTHVSRIVRRLLWDHI